MLLNTARLFSAISITRARSRSPSSYSNVTLTPITAVALLRGAGRTAPRIGRVCPTGGTDAEMAAAADIPRAPRTRRARNRDPPAPGGSGRSRCGAVVRGLRQQTVAMPAVDLHQCADAWLSLLPLLAGVAHREAIHHPQIRVIPNLGHPARQRHVLVWVLAENPRSLCGRSAGGRDGCSERDSWRALRSALLPAALARAPMGQAMPLSGGASPGGCAANLPSRASCRTCALIVWGG